MRCREERPAPAQAVGPGSRRDRPRLVTVDLTEDGEGDDKVRGGVPDVFLERLPPEAEPRA